jgi:hypothetical protein
MVAICLTPTSLLLFLPTILAYFSNFPHLHKFSSLPNSYNSIQGGRAMLRKLTVFICLLSFAPAAVNAQGIAAIAATPVAVESAAVPASLPERTMDLSLPTARSTAVLMAAADTSQGIASAPAPEQKKAEKDSSFHWENFAEVHLGDYRWVWWVVAAAALIAIHASAGD